MAEMHHEHSDTLVASRLKVIQQAHSPKTSLSHGVNLGARRRDRFITCSWLSFLKIRACEFGYKSTCSDLTLQILDNDGEDHRDRELR